MTTPGLNLPLVIAAVFTLGCILIGRAGRHSEAVTGVLGLMLLLCALLNAITLVAFLAGARTSGTMPIRLLPGQ